MEKETLENAAETIFELAGKAANLQLPIPGPTFLTLREILNITISVMMLILTVLLAYYIAYDLKAGYRKLTWTTKLLIGFFFITLGELLRSATIYIALHYGGGRIESDVNYIFYVIPVVAAQILIPVGALCVIRNFSPKRMKHLPWIAALVLTIFLVAANFLVP